MAYYKFSTYLKDKFQTKVHKLSLDAGFSCPNRDGKISTSGCIYCDNRTFSFEKRRDKDFSLKEQVEDGLKALKKKVKAKKFIAYFQAHTNTYAPLAVLKERYDIIKEFDDIIGLSIATRPDCVDKDILELLDSYTDNYEVWIEYGLQSMHNKTLDFINRGHKYENFLKAVELTRKYRIKICAHVIIGLPGETEEMILETANAVAGLQVDGIKIHPLHIVKGTKLEELFLRGEYAPLELDDYVKLLGKFLDCLPKRTIIHRISASCPKELLVAPKWISEKNRVEKELKF